MKWKGLLFLAVGLVTGMLLGAVILSNGQPAAGSLVSRRNPPVVGSPAPDFVLNRLGGGSQRLSALKGKPVVVNFWATWCPPCKEEMPLLDQYAQKYDQRLVVIGVDSEESESQVAGFIKEMGVRFPILLDTYGVATDLYFVRNFPMTFFIDEQGVLRSQHLGQLQEDILVRYLATIGIKP